MTTDLKTRRPESKISKVVTQLIRNGNITPMEGVAMKIAVESFKMNDKDVKKYGTLTVEALEELRR